jgi:membrane associated rhomboid family serine protease
VTNWVRFLLYANVGVFFLQLVQPGIERWLLFYPPWMFTRPWTLVTYMFLHGGLMHILFNMLGLFFFGSQVEARLGGRRFLTLYFISGVSGAVLSYILSPASPIVGASAGVFGVMLAFAKFWPDEVIMIWGIIPVPARVLVIITTLFAIWSGFGGVGSGIAHFAHLGGYAGAFLYLLWLDRVAGSFRKRAEGATAPKPSWGNKRPNVDLSRVHELNRDEVNRILDKISARGVGSLTPQERTFLSNFVPPDDRVPPVS